MLLPPEPELALPRVARAFPVAQSLLDVYQENLLFRVHTRVRKQRLHRVNGVWIEMPRLVADALCELLLPECVLEEERAGFARNGRVFRAHSAEHLAKFFDDDNWARVRLHTENEYAHVAFQDALGEHAPFVIHVSDHPCKPRMARLRMSFVWEADE